MDTDIDRERTVLSAMDNIINVTHTEEEHSYGLEEYYEINAVTLDMAKDDIAFLAKEFEVSGKQAVLFSIIVELCKCDELDKSNLSRSLKTNFVQFLTFEEDLRQLAGKRLIQRCRWGRIKVTEGAMKALEENRAYRQPPVTNLTTNKILGRMTKIIKGIQDEEIDRKIGLDDIDAMILANPQTCLAKVANEYGILTFGAMSSGDDDDDNRHDYRMSMDRPFRMMFYVMCFRYHDCDDDSVIWWDFRNIYDEDDMEIVQNSVRDNCNPLFKKKVLTFSERDGMVVKDHFMIADDFKEKMLADAGGLHERTILSGLKLSTEIPEKELFYDSSEAQQVESLEAVLNEDRYREVCNALKSKGMRHGLTCLFHGCPGTGKTETVYQIARKTGRDLITADVAKLKSCWVGESEKNVKNLFRKYKKCVKESKVTPILLFNEADAIFGIRKSGAESAVDKMENSIQNIILQEMEDLDGILIATTNLTENLDKAFERRFLYKIHFNKPSSHVRSKIWLSMIPELNSNQALRLSEKFDFTGGQIENISRKRTVQSIVTCKEPSFDEMVAFCNEELIDGKSGKSNKIGF